MGGRTSGSKCSSFALPQPGSGMTGSTEGRTSGSKCPPQPGSGKTGSTEGRTSGSKYCSFVPPQPGSGKTGSTERTLSYDSFEAKFSATKKLFRLEKKTCGTEVCSTSFGSLPERETDTLMKTKREK